MNDRRRATRQVLEVAAEAKASSHFIPVEGHKRGGYWIGATSIDRMVYGYSKENAAAVQQILARFAGWPVDQLHEEKRDKRGRRQVCKCAPCRAIRASIGEYCTIERAESELIQAKIQPEKYGADRSAGRMRKARAAAVEAGKCIVCRTEDAREGKKTCYLCNARAMERVSRAREEAKERKRLDIVA